MSVMWFSWSFAFLLSQSFLLALSTVVALSGDSLFHFILRFWNHVFTCVSFRLRVCAILERCVVSRYLCSENVFSKIRNCNSVKTVRDLRHLLPLWLVKEGFTRKYTGREFTTRGLSSVGRNEEYILDYWNYLCVFYKYVRNIHTNSYLLTRLWLTCLKEIASSLHDCSL